MKLSLYIFIISFAINQEFGLAKVANIPRSVSRFICCNAERPHDMSYFFKVKDFVNQCVKDLALDDQPDTVVLSQYSCVIQCVGKYLNITDAEGNIEEEQFRNFIKYEVPLFAHQKAIAGSVAMNCFEQSKASDNAAVIDAETLEYNGCSSSIQRIMGCVNLEFVKACPKEMQSTHRGCSMLRQLIDSGKLKKHTQRPFDINFNEM